MRVRAPVELRGSSGFAPIASGSEMIATAVGAWFFFCALLQVLVLARRGADVESASKWRCTRIAQDSNASLYASRFSSSNTHTITFSKSFSFSRIAATAICAASRFG